MEKGKGKLLGEVEVWEGGRIVRRQRKADEGKTTHSSSPHGHT